MPISDLSDIRLLLWETASQLIPKRTVDSQRFNTFNA